MSDEEAKFPNDSRSPLLSQQVVRILDDARLSGDFVVGWQGYRPLVEALAGAIESPMLLEVGGGRTPLMTQELISSLGARYVVNDIDADELAQAPLWVDTLHGDICDPLLVTPENEGTYELIFSLMVFEHVKDPAQAYRNIARLLSPGGVVLNFVPTLFALPFVINRMLPDGITSRVLRIAFPRRNQHAIPKFPAYYAWCRAMRGTAKRVEECGFAESVVVPFYGHRYYSRIPVLKTFERWFARLAERRGWRAAASYAYIIARR